MLGVPSIARRVVIPTWVVPRKLARSNCSIECAITSLSIQDTQSQGGDARVNVVGTLDLNCPSHVLSACGSCFVKTIGSKFESISRLAAPISAAHVSPYLVSLRQQ